MEPVTPASGAAVGPTRHLVVMGVSGVGKSTVARRLAADLGLELAEGDDFHPRANIDTMSSGEALTDEDRWPWLEALADLDRRAADPAHVRGPRHGVRHRRDRQGRACGSRSTRRGRW